MFWNGDGGTKDNAQAAHYWRIAWAAGRRDAALYLGDEAFVRGTSSPSPTPEAIATVGEAVKWYEVAAKTPSVAAAGAERLKMIDGLGFPPGMLR